MEVKSELNEANFEGVVFKQRYLQKILTSLVAAKENFNNAIEYLESTGQGGLVTAFGGKFNIESLDTMINEIKKYLK